MKKMYMTGAYIALFYMACFALEQAEPQIGEPYYEEITAYKSDTIGATIGI